MLILRDGDAKAKLQQLEKTMENKSSVKGFFREDSYNWTAFHFQVLSTKNILKVTTFIQHEGYALKRLNLTPNDIQHYYD
jgi:hypothetical protein